MSDRPTPCPDCDPHGFHENLRAFYGPPAFDLGGIRVYADPRVASAPALGPTAVDAASFARAFCPKHGRALQAPRDVTPSESKEP